jgi:hypothetical protein
MVASQVYFLLMDYIELKNFLLLLQPLRQKLDEYFDLNLSIFFHQKENLYQ